MKAEIFKSKKIVNALGAIKYLLFFAMFFVLWKAGIKNNIFPFAIGLFLALCWCNQNVFILSLMFILTGYLSCFELTNLWLTLSCSGFMIIVTYIHKAIKSPIKIWLLCIYAFVCHTMLILYSLGSNEALLSAVISIMVAIIFMLACIKIFKAFLVKGIGLKLTIDEIISLCLILMSINLGLSTITIWNISLSKIFSIFIIMLAIYLYDGASSMIISVVLGLGEALYSNNLTMCAGYALLGLAGLSFRTSHCYYSAVAVLLADLVLGLYFNLYSGYSIFSFLSTFIGVGLFVLIKKDTLSILKILIGGENKNQASRDVVNRSRNELSKRMFEISNIFYEMNNTFRNTVKGVLPLEEAKKMLAQEVMQKVCADCPERYKCLRSLADETNKVFDDIISAGFERGRTNILDVPAFLSTRCSRVNIILQAINQLIVSYKQYANMVVSMDTSRVLIADQLAGVSQLLKILATDTLKLIEFDTAKENQIIDELNYCNILANEVVVYEKDTQTSCVTMVVRENDANENNILKVLAKVCKTKMLLSSSTPSQVPSFVVNTYITAPKYDLIYGSSGCPKHKNSVSGDSYSFIKLSPDKVLLALCDGMGSGEQAQNTSDTAISLIENFYKAGFDNEIILNSVNRFLSINSEENYSALDLCVVDLNSATADLVKVGAPEGLIKHSGETEILQAGALPLGILEEIKPSIIKKNINSQDMIIMCSDGIVDSFGGIEQLQKFVSLIDTTNPQTMSDEILAKAIELSSKKLKDDCTVIAARIFERV